MANFDLSQARKAVNLGSSNFVTFGSFVSSTPNFWDWLSTAGHRLDVVGGGFTYVNGQATAGTANAIGFDLGNDSANATELTITGLNVAAATLDDDANSFWRILDGNDTITGLLKANFPGVGQSTIFGDGIEARNGATGGKDTIDTGDTSILVYGDVTRVGGPGLTSIVYTGGDDVITARASTEITSICGDVDQVRPGCKLIGGGDSLFLKASNFPEAIGDAREARGVSGSLAEVVGGNDFLDASGVLSSTSNVGAFLIGDVLAQDDFASITGGADTLLGCAFDDRMYGDVLSASATFKGGDDIMYGGNGADQMYGEFSNGVGFMTTGGNDRMFGEGGTDFMRGQSGNDILDGGTEVDDMAGGTGNDQFFVDQTFDVVREAVGEGTADRVYTTVNFSLGAGQEIEILTTTNSALTTGLALTGNGFANNIVGNNGNNLLNGASGIDRLTGLLGNDLYYVDNFSDVVIEGANGGTADRVLTSVNYVLADNQQIELFSTTNNAGVSAINLVGNNLANRILGNNGANVINGGLANDVLTGGLGADQFRFSTAIAGGGNVDTIADFTHLTDDMQLAQGIFINIGGTLDAAEFKLGTTATTTAQRIIYDGVTGNLFFDADGSGATAQVQFAKVTAATVLDTGDFIMI